MQEDSGEVYPEAREQLGLSVSELAQRAGVNGSTIRRVEAGTFAPQARTRRALRAALGLDGAEAPAARPATEAAALSRLVATWYAVPPERRPLVQSLMEALAGFDCPNEAGAAAAG